MKTRRAFFSALGFILALCSVLYGQDKIAGTWKGTLPKSDLALVFTFDETGKGTVNSVKQNFKSAASIKVSGSNVTISVPEVQGTFTGTLEDGKMSGTWTQGSGYSDTLELAKQ